ALQEQRLDVLRADAELVGELLDGRALDESNLFQITPRPARRGDVQRLRDAALKRHRARRREGVALEAAPAFGAFAVGRGHGATAATAVASAGAARVGGRDVSGLRRRGLAGRAVQRLVPFAPASAPASFAAPST